MVLDGLHKNGRTADLDLFHLGFGHALFRDVSVRPRRSRKEPTLILSMVRLVVMFTPEIVLIAADYGC